MTCAKCKRPRYRGPASNLEGLCLQHLKESTDKIMSRKAPVKKIDTTANDYLNRLFS